MGNGTVTKADNRMKNFPAVWQLLVWLEELGGERHLEVTRY